MLGITWLSFNLILAIAGIFYVLDYFGFLRTIPLVNTLSGKMPRNPVFLMGAIVLVAVGFGWVSVGSVGETIDNEAPGPEVTTNIKEQQTVDLEEKSGGGGWSEKTLIFTDTHEIHSNEDATVDLAVADLNDDGNLDIVDAESDRNHWYENDGNGTFTAHEVHDNSNWTKNVAIADLNDDGHPDIVAGNYEENYWYENDGNGTFTAHEVHDNKILTGSLAIADLNDDGHPDIVAGNYEENYWYENNGDDTFTAHEIHGNSHETESLAVADLNDDGHLDVVAGNLGGEKNYWYENNGDDTFTAHEIHGNSHETEGLAVADLNDDGHLDILAGNNADKNYWYENNGDGTFTAHEIHDNEQETEKIVVADLNDDGHPDVVEGNYGMGEGEKNYWYENNGDDTFTAHEIHDDEKQTEGLAVADLNNDGHLDVVTGNYNENYWYETDFVH